MNRLALFDCDGTLVDSQANICLAMEHAFEEAGLTPPLRTATRRIVGLSLVEAMRTLLPESEDALRVRAGRNLPPDALRDSKGSAIGWFLYSGMPPDFCKSKAYDEAS